MVGSREESVACVAFSLYIIHTEKLFHHTQVDFLIRESSSVNQNLLLSESDNQMSYLLKDGKGSKISGREIMLH